MHCTMSTNALYSAPPPNFFPYGYPSPLSAGPFPIVPFPPQFSQPTPFNYPNLHQFSYPPPPLPQLNPNYGAHVQARVPCHPPSPLLQPHHYAPSPVSPPPPPSLLQLNHYEIAQHQARAPVSPPLSPPPLPNALNGVQAHDPSPVPSPSPAPSPVPQPNAQIQPCDTVSPPVPTQRRDWDYDRMTAKNNGNITTATYKKRMEALLKKTWSDKTDLDILALCVMRNRFLDPDVLDLHYLRRELASKVLSARVKEIRAGQHTSNTLYVGTGKGNNSKEGARTIKEDVIENAAKAGIKCKQMPGNGGILILEISPK